MLYFQALTDMKRDTLRAFALADNRQGLYNITHAHINKHLNRCRMHISGDTVHCEGHSLHPAHTYTETLQIQLSNKK